jgi:probable phosphoglycerate mutase
MSAQRVLLLRHGRTAYNAEERFQGQADVPLDEVGLGQAKRAADELMALLAGAQVIGIKFGVPVTLDARLREISAGEWQGLTRDEIKARWGADYEAWRRGDDVRVGGGETRSEAGGRAAEAIAEAAAAMDGGTLVCVSHGGSLRGAIFLLTGTPTWPWSALESLRNAHWAELRNVDRGWQLSCYNVG